MRACTVYSCQVGTEKLSRAAVAEHALKLADTEGLDAVTIRRLAKELGVTPMALYWHFNNKEELLQGIADHALADVKATRKLDDPWQRQLRAMVEALVAVMREHPCLPDLFQSMHSDLQPVASFTRATNDALELLARGGFELEQGYWIASYLLQGAIGLVATQPGCPPTVAPEEEAEWRRQKRLSMEQLSSDEYPLIVRLAPMLEHETDIEQYYRFGIDLLMAGVEAVAFRSPGE
jgi:TetR/AcrR family transcriptional regulator, tetracycline repressor protein